MAPFACAHSGFFMGGEEVGEGADAKSDRSAPLRQDAVACFHLVVLLTDLPMQTQQAPTLSPLLVPIVLNSRDFDFSDSYLMISTLESWLINFWN